MSSPELSPTLKYFKRLYLQHGFYFGRLGQSAFEYSRWAKCLLILYTAFQFAFNLKTIFALLSLPAGQWFAFSDNENKQIKASPDLLANLKPVTISIFIVINILSNICRLTTMARLPFQGGRILHLANHQLYRTFDVSTNFRGKFIKVFAAATIIITMLDIIAMFSVFNYNSWAPKIMFMLSIYLNTRYDLWPYILQYYVLEANRYWFERLRVATERSAGSVDQLRHYTRLADILLRQLRQFYQSVSFYIFLNFVFLMSMCTVSQLFVEIKLVDTQLAILFYISTFNIVTQNVAILWLASCRLNKVFAQFRRILSTKVVQCEVNGQDPRSLWTYHSIRLWGMQVKDFDQNLQIARLFPLNFATFLSVLVFSFDLSIMIYQTEYM